MTMGEMMDRAIACTTKEEATALVDEVVAGLPKEMPEDSLREIIRRNVGYCSGYYSRETAARLLELFETKHPYFGAIGDWPKTPEETMAMGMRMGQRARDEALND